jgi:hypothetical protein
MQKRITVRILIFTLVLLGVPLAARPSVLAADSYQDTKGEGKALVEDLLSRVPPANTEILGLLKIRPAEGALIEVPTKMTVRIADDGWHDIYQTQPVLNRPGEILLIKHARKQPNQYLYAKYQDARTEPVLQPIAADQLYQPLAGSDFALGDLGLEFLHWPSQKIIKKEMRKGRSCRVVESVNPKPAPGEYSRVLSWLDLETSNLIRAEAYDLNNRELKEFQVKKISRTEGKVEVKEMEIGNEQTDSRTRLEFNLEVADGGHAAPMKRPPGTP